MNSEEITLGDLEGNAELCYNEVMFNRVVNENYANMLGYCARAFQTIDSSTAEDLVQQVFMELVRQIQTLLLEQRNSPAREWLFGRLKWRCLNEVNRRKRSQLSITPVGSQEPEENPIEQIPDYAPTPDELIVEQERHELVWGCLERLSRRERQVIELLRQGLRPGEIAERLQISNACVTYYKNTAIGKLNRMLQELGI